jgi:5'-methylthioadenosine phosphorylase
MCYATLAAITDYDCWHPTHASVSIDMIISNLNKNIENAKKIMVSAIRNMGNKETCACQGALKHAIVTQGEFIPPKIKRNLNIIIGKYVR